MSSATTQYGLSVEQFFNEINNLAHFDGPQKIELSTRFSEWQNIRTGDRVIPPSTLYHFFDFAFEGHKPGGGRARHPLLTEDEVPLLSMPLAQWALSTYNASTPVSIIDQTLARCAHESMVVPVPYPIYDLKVRLWEGMSPMTRSRWFQKQLHKPEQWNDAMGYFFQVVWTFLYLNKLQLLYPMKEGFSLISQDLARFESAINMRRRARDSNAPQISMQALWQEFLEAWFNSMARRSHSWMVDRVADIKISLKEEHDAAYRTTKPEDRAALNKAFIDKAADLEKILGQADYTVYMSMHGFGTYSNPANAHLGTIIDRHTFFYECADNMSWSKTASLLNNMQDPNLGIASRDAMLAVDEEANNNRSQIRSLIRPPSSDALGEEHWITVLRSRIRWSLAHGGPRDQTWGFVAYRLTYKQSKSEWAQLVDKVDHDRKESKSWSSEQGTDIFDTAGLLWLDGEELGIPEGDIEAAKRHFEKFKTTSQMLPRIIKNHFVVVDQIAYESYMENVDASSSLAPIGDYVGHLHFLDLMFDPQNNLWDAYSGTLRIAGSLIWNHLYPLLMSPTTVPGQMYMVAMTHPYLLYTGSTMHKQDRERDLVCTMRDVCMAEYAKKMKSEASSGVEDQSI